MQWKWIKFIFGTISYSDDDNGVTMTISIEISFVSYYFYHELKM